MRVHFFLEIKSMRAHFLIKSMRAHFSGQIECLTQSWATCQQKIFADAASVQIRLAKCEGQGDPDGGSYSDRYYRLVLGAVFDHCRAEKTHDVCEGQHKNEQHY